MPAALGDELLILDGAFGLTDQSGNGWSASYQGGMGVAFDAVVGRNVYLLDGIDDAIEIASAVRSSMPVTLTAWVKCTSVAGGNADNIVSISRADATSHFWLMRQNGVTIEARSRAGSTGVGSTLTGLTTAWCHIIAEFASATSRTIYLNGTAGTTNTASRSPVSVDRFNIGRSYGADNVFLDGCVTDVRVFARALTSTERTTLGASIGFDAASSVVQSRRRRDLGGYGL